MGSVKELYCYCHWGGVRRNVAGQIVVEGGNNQLLYVDESTLYDQFVAEACDACSIDSRNKSFVFCTNEETGQMVSLQNQRSLTLMLRLHSGAKLHVFIADGMPNGGQLADAMVSNHCSHSVPPVHYAGEAAHLHDPSHIGPLPHMLVVSPLKHVLASPIHEVRGTNSDRETSPAPSGHDHVVNDAAMELRSACFEPPCLPIYDPPENHVIDGTIIASHVDDIHFQKGSIFQDTKAFRRCLYFLTLNKKFNCRWKDNNKGYLRVICSIKGCPWYLTAACDGESTYVRVLTYTATHTHNMGDDASYVPVVKAKYLGEKFKRKIVESPDFSPNKIRTIFHEDHKVRMSYNQAWSVKEWAKASIEGGVPAQGYAYIPWLCERLTAAIPGTRATYRTATEDNHRFNQLFVAYGTSIAGFHTACRPLIFMDSCFLKNFYKGCVFSACALDSNNGLYPLAYFIASVENDVDWYWFLSELREVLDKKTEFVFMTDKNKSLVDGIAKLFGPDCNCHCLHHLKENFCKYLVKNNGWKTKKCNTALELLDRLARARDHRQFMHHYGEMCKLDKNFSLWLEQNKPQHWANAYFPFRRWDWLSSNPAESYNAWLGKHHLRELNIHRFIKEHVVILTSFLAAKSESISKWRAPVGPRIEEKIEKSKSRALSLISRCMFNQTFTVSDSHNNNYAVDLSQGHCSCQEMEYTGIPCPHAMEVLLKSRMSVYDLVDPVFLVDQQKLLFEHQIPPIPTSNEPTFDQIQLDIEEDARIGNPRGLFLVQPPRTKRPAGRPRTTRIESQFQGKRIFRCSRCNQSGHNRSSCKSAINEAGTTYVTNNQEV